MSNAPTFDIRLTVRPGKVGITTDDAGRINFRMVMHNAHLLAKQEANRDRFHNAPVKAYRVYFAEQLRDQLLHTHSMSAWKRGNGVKVDAGFIASVSTDGPIHNYKIAAE